MRIGLHTGEAVREADDFYSRHVNLASRIAFGEGREVGPKGLSGRQPVHEVEWQ